MKYYLIVGEASGDLHASHLMAALKAEDADASFRFFGGDLMKAVGGTMVKHYKELAYMGFVPVLMHLRTIFANMKRCKQDIAIGMAGKATLLATARQGLFFIPIILLLSWLFGLLGVQMSQAIADLFSFGLAVPIATGALKKLKQMEEKTKKKENDDMIAEQKKNNEEAALIRNNIKAAFSYRT